MSHPDLTHLVQADRMHRSVHTDQAIFDLEMTHIFEKTWKLSASLEIRVHNSSLVPSL
jgi:hypothetical protein